MGRNLGRISYQQLRLDRVPICDSMEALEGSPFECVPWWLPGTRSSAITMRTMRHIWRYLTSPTYRIFVDLQTCQQAVDAHMNMMRDQLERAELPPLVVEVMDKYALNANYAVKLLEAEKRI